MSKGKKRKQKVVDTIISEGTIIEGKINHKTSLRIDGKVHGEIICDGNVYIGSGGFVKETIRANNIIISGEVNGDLHAFDKVHIQSTGKLTGKAHTKGIIIDEGGIFNGESIISTDEEKVSQITQSVKQKTEKALHH